MTPSEKKRISFTIRLEDKLFDIFHQTKEETGIQSNAEVIRYIVTQYDRLRKK